MGQGLEGDLDRLMATLCRYFADEGKAREVAILAEARASVDQTSSDNWDGGVYGYTVNLVLPEAL